LHFFTFIDRSLLFESSITFEDTTPTQVIRARPERDIYGSIQNLLYYLVRQVFSDWSDRDLDVSLLNQVDD
jgi:hypothetical protein